MWVPQRGDINISCLAALDDEKRTKKELADTKQKLAEMESKIDKLLQKLVPEEATKPVAPATDEASTGPLEKK